MTRTTTALVLATAAFCVFGFAGCGGGTRLLSRDDEIQLGREAGDDFEREEGLDNDPALRSLVASVGERVARAAQPPDYPYDFRVLRGKDVNAVAFPGGRIYVWRGLIETFDSDRDTLAWVLAHESAHVARRHATRRMEKALGFEALITIALRKQGARELAGLVAGLVVKDYGRDQEFEADRYGLLYAHEAGYDPTAAVAVLNKFRELQQDEPSDFELLFATHPGNNDRINNVKAYITSKSWSGRYWSP